MISKYAVTPDLLNKLVKILKFLDEDELIVSKRLLLPADSRREHVEIKWYPTDVRFFYYVAYNGDNKNRKEGKIPVNLKVLNDMYVACYARAIERAKDVIMDKQAEDYLDKEVLNERKK